MPEKITTKRLLRYNYMEIIIVLASFALMALSAYFFIGRILRERLLEGAETLFSSVEANVRSGLVEVETTLLNSSNTVQDMVRKKSSKQEISAYLTNTTEWIREQKRSLFRVNGVYAYINGEYCDGMGFVPGDDYIPQRRPWYQTAVRSGGAIAYTAPYEDVQSGETVISAVKTINGNDGLMAGIIVIDINLGWLSEYIKSFELAPGGYGMLLSQNMTIIIYPDDEYLNKQFGSLKDSYNQIEMELRKTSNISAKHIKDSDNKKIIVFFRKVFNGWYVGSVTPYSSFYGDLYTAALILAFLWIALSFLLCFILLRLSSAKMRADEDSKAKSSFLASMSHEIRTPINAITGMAELALRGNISDEIRGYVQDIKQAGNNLVSIINDILDFSKIEAGKLEIVPVKYLFSSLINDSANIINMRIGEKPLRFSTNIDGNIPNNLIGDEVRLRQILLNLLSNAVKYSEKGQIGLTVTIHKRDNEKIWLKISVTDTGKGIKPEDRGKLFGEFVQVDLKKNMGIEGTGLGLAITKRLCTAMGGDITVESEYGKGSVFTVIIPQVVASETPLYSAVDSNDYNNSKGTGSAIRHTFPTARLLVVDDIATNLKVAEGLLAPYGATVDTCISGIRAVELARKREYDMIFMDHMMPEMDGLEATAAIREIEKENDELGISGKRVPIIALTANAVVGMKEMFMEKGFNDFLSKPIDVGKLDEMLERWIPKDKKVVGTRDQGLGSVVIGHSETADTQSLLTKTPVPSTQYPVPISGVDIEKGIAMTGGTLSLYREVLTLFRDDARERRPLLQTVPEADALPAFVTQVHALKSASASIGAAEFSAKAAALEAAGKAGNLAFIEENLPVFAESLSRLVEGIKAWETAQNEHDSKKQAATQGGGAPPSDRVTVGPLLNELAQALKLQKAEDIDRILEQLAGQPLDSGVKTAVDRINDEVLVAEYEKAWEILNNLIIGSDGQ